jgi:hypothetical protein
VEDSILKTVKKFVGVVPDDDSFDLDLLVATNSAFSNLTQMGIGPAEGITVEDEATSWNLLDIPLNQINMAKTYVCLKVRLAFDPPAFSFHIDAIKEQIAEQEARLSLYRETLITNANRPVADQVVSLWG